ncbi:MAG: uroporphyrinogen-III C-methyltransferase [Actinobacteria bacterium]|nr:uroporphyrinogen-III C-methyltransferase [Actinomycetota bacterium]
MTVALQALIDGLGGPPARPGTVYLVGGGPGDPGLLTLRAAVVLSTCDLVAYDRLAPAEALRLAPPDAELICVGKRSGEQGLSRAAVDDLLVSRARAGDAVVRLKGGDPFVFGRGGEEAAACRAHGVAVEVVSGVTSAVAVPAAAGIPLTHRTVASGFAVVTGHEDPAESSGSVDHALLADFPGTVVVLMGVGQVRAFAAALISHGKPADTPVALVRWGTTARQETVEGTLATIAAEVQRRGLRPPAVAVIGDVVRLRGGIGGREDLPLMGRTVLVPRTLHRPSALAARIRSAGGEPLEVQVARPGPGDTAGLHAAARDLAAGAYATLVASGPPAVTALADALAAAGLDARALAGVRVAAVGRGAVRALGDRLAIRADVTGADLDQLARRLAELDDRGGTLVLAADPGDPGPLATFHPVVVTAYALVAVTDVPDRLRREVQDGMPLLAAVASSTAATGLARLLGDATTRVAAATIGAHTTRAAREAGLTVAAEAAEPDLDALVAAVIEAARSQPGANNVSDGPRPLLPVEDRP